MKPRREKIKGILVISGCGNSGLVNKESMQIRNKDFIFHKSIGATVPDFYTSFVKMTAKKLKNLSPRSRFIWYPKK